jgi:hypothetical protein
MNRSLQEARARARGYRRVENFIAMAYLIAGKLTLIDMLGDQRSLNFRQGYFASSWSCAAVL